jgi:hypothetical protein
MKTTIVLAVLLAGTPAFAPNTAPLTTTDRDLPRRQCETTSWAGTGLGDSDHDRMSLKLRSFLGGTNF